MFSTTESMLPLFSTSSNPPKLLKSIVPSLLVTSVTFSSDLTSSITPVCSLSSKIIFPSITSSSIDKTPSASVYFINFFVFFSFIIITIGFLCLIISYYKV